ncbi:MAG TPA: hypothetical protein PK950_01610 [Candidatus Paceibacterota bacterium]|nr:hypothetical protein [Candidatus Paceibacterota bacterium]
MNFNKMMGFENKAETEKRAKEDLNKALDSNFEEKFEAVRPTLEAYEKEGKFENTQQKANELRERIRLDDERKEHEQNRIDQLRAELLADPKNAYIQKESETIDIEYEDVTPMKEEGSKTDGHWREDGTWSDKSGKREILSSKEMSAEERERAYSNLPKQEKRDIIFAPEMTSEERDAAYNNLPKQNREILFSEEKSPEEVQESYNALPKQKRREFLE